MNPQTAEYVRTRAWVLGRVALLVALVVLGAAGTTGCATEQSLFEELESQGQSFIGSVDPETGTVGTPIQILGGGFGAVQGAGKVEFFGARDGGPVSAAIEGWSDKGIAARVPAVAVFNQPIRVEVVNDAGQRAAFPALFVVVGNSAPAPAQGTGEDQDTQ